MGVEGRRIEIEEIPPEKRWKRLLNICMDYYHTWREVIVEEFGTDKAKELEVKWGKRLGEKTADIYKRVRWPATNLMSLAKALVISMRILNEDCEAVMDDANSVRIVHYHCPEHDEYAKRGLLGGCIDKCLAWFEATVKSINPLLKVELLKTFQKDNLCEIRIKAT